MHAEVIFVLLGFIIKKTANCLLKNLNPILVHPSLMDVDRFPSDHTTFAIEKLDNLTTEQGFQLFLIG